MGYIAIVSPLYHLLVPCSSYKFIPPYPWKSCMISPRNREHVWLNTVDGCEILHHQKGGWNRNKMMGCLPPINWWFAFRWPIHRIATITNFPIILPSFSHHSPIIFAWRFAWRQECSLMTVKTYMLLSGVLVLRREKVPELVLGRGGPTVHMWIEPTGVHGWTNRALGFKAWKPTGILVTTKMVRMWWDILWKIVNNMDSANIILGFQRKKRDHTGIAQKKEWIWPTRNEDFSKKTTEYKWDSPN